MSDENLDEAPHAWRQHGWLKNDNTPGNLALVKRCGAQTRAGSPCRSPAMANRRCRMHGGKSTGARTAEGLQRSRKAPIKHGLRSAAVVTKRRHMIGEVRAIILKTSALLREADDYIRKSRKTKNNAT